MTDDEVNRQPPQDDTPEKRSRERTQSAVRSFLIAAIWIFLAVAWTNMSAVFRFAAAAAGVGFAVEGLLKLRKK